MTVEKVSDITTQNLVEYLRLSEPDGEDVNTLTSLLNIAKSYIQSETGQKDLDKHSDFVIVALILVQDMWDHRTMYVDKGNVNKVVESILGLHAVNLL